MSEPIDHIKELIAGLDEDAQRAILKASSAMKEEVEILNFRLKRMEKIKRTTAIFLDESVAELEEKRKAVEEANAALEEAMAQLKVDGALERIRSEAMAMQSSKELLNVVLTMHHEFEGLGHPISMFWHAKWTEKGYEKALTGFGGAQVEFIMDLPRDFSAVPALMEWERNNEKLGVFKFNPDAAVAYLGHMIENGDFQKIDPSHVTEEDIRASGGFTFVQAKTTHGEIGYLLSGETDPSEEAKAVLLRFAGAFDLAYRRFEDLQKAESDLEKLKEEKSRTEAALKDLRATQAQLVEQEKLASLGSLTAGIAHEIKNPLNFVNNFAEVGSEMADELAEAIAKGDTEEMRQLIDELKANAAQIAKHGRRADDIVKAMMQHARGGTSERETVVLNDFLEEYANLAWHGMRARDHGFQADLIRDYDDSIGSMALMPQEMGRVILNLLNNAFDVVKGVKGAKITLTTRNLEDGRNPKGHPTEMESIEITVSDNGSGIPADIRAKIFEPFFTTKPTGEGTGLGLSLSHDIVSKGHGGTMTVQDGPHGGAEFVIRLPT